MNPKSTSRSETAVVFYLCCCKDSIEVKTSAHTIAILSVVYGYVETEWSFLRILTRYLSRKDDDHKIAFVCCYIFGDDEFHYETDRDMEDKKKCGRGRYPAECRCQGSQIEQTQ